LTEFWLKKTDFACFKFLLFTEITDGLPVVVMDTKPLTVSRSNIDIYGTKVIVLLVSWWHKHQTWNLTSIKNYSPKQT